MTATTEKIANGLKTSEIANIQLKDIVKGLPSECFEKYPVKAWSFVALSVVTAIIGYLGIIYLPWYCLPVTWIFTGTA